MSWTDEEIDRLFKDGAEQVSFGYKEEYWKEMEAMLPEKKRKPDFLWFLTAFLLTGALTTGYFTMNGTQELSPNQLLASEKLNSQENNTQKNLSTANSGIENQDSKAGDFQSNSVDNLSSGSRTAALSHDNASRRGVESEITHAPTKITAQESQVNVIASPLDLAPTLLSESESWIGDNAQDALVKSDSRSVETNSDFVEENYEIGSLLTRPLELSEMQNSLMSGQYAAMNRVIDGRPVFRMYVQGIAGLSESLVSPSTSGGSSYGGGLGLQMHVNGWTTTLGINGLVNNYSDIELSRKAKLYGFGSELVTHNFDYKTLYTMEGVLSLGRNFGRHQLLLGVRPTYVVSTVVEYGQAVEGTTVQNTREVRNYMDGLVRFGIKPMVGYSVNFGENWTTGINVGVQLNDAFRSGYVTKENNAFPVDGQLYLRRNFSLKK